MVVSASNWSVFVMVFVRVGRKTVVVWAYLMYLLTLASRLVVVLKVPVKVVVFTTLVELFESVVVVARVLVELVVVVTLLVKLCVDVLVVAGRVVCRV